MAETVDITTLALKVDATEARVASLELEKLGKSATKAGAETDNFVKAVEREAATLGKSRSSVISLEAAKMGLTKTQMEQVRAANAAIAAYERQRAAVQQTERQVNSSAHSMGLGMAGLKSAIIGAFSAAAIYAGVKQFLGAMADAQRSLDRLRNGFNFAFGTESGAKQLENVRQMARQYGLELKATADAYVRLSAAAKGTTLEGAQNERIFRAVSGAATVLGMAVGETEATFRAIQQMISKGSVQAEELRGQLGERLPGAFQIAARAMGVTTMQLGKMLEQGEVMAATFLPKFAAELEKTFGDDIVRAGNSLTANTNRMSSAWMTLKQTIADSGIGDAIAAMMKRVTDVLDGVTAAIERAKAAGGGFWSQMFAAAGAAKTITTPGVPASDRGRLAYVEGEQAAALARMGQMVDAYVKHAEAGNRGLAKAMEPTIARLKEEIVERGKTIDKMREQLKLTDDLKAGRSGSAADPGAEERNKLAQLREEAERLLGKYKPSADQFAEIKGRLTKYLELGAITKLEFDKALAEADRELNKSVNKSAEERATAMEAARNLVRQASGTSSEYAENVRKLNEGLRLGAIDGMEYAFAMEYLNRTQTEAGKSAEKLREDQKRLNDEALEQSMKSVEQQTADLERQAQAMETQVSKLSMTEEAYYRAAAAQLEMELSMLGAGERTAWYTQQLESQIKALNRLAEAAGKKGALRNEDDKERARFASMREALRALKTDAMTVGDILSSSFGKFGEKLAGLTDALGEFGVTQGRIMQDFEEAMRDAATSTDPLGEIGKAVQKQQDEAARSSLKMYGDMAGAAKGFFKEHTAGYRILDATEKAFRAAELAMALQSFATKMGHMLGLTTVKATTTATNIGLEATETAASVAGSGTRTIASTIAGVAKAFEQMGVWGFVGAAAILAFMAALGANAGGGGGGGVPEMGSVERQRTQGTGTVLGDKDAKSESLLNALEILRSNSDDDLLYTSQMLNALRGIESNMRGLSQMAARMGLTGEGVRLPGDTRGNAFSLDDAGLILGRYLGGSSEHARFGGQSVRDLVTNPAATQYTDIRRTHTGTFANSNYSAVNTDYAVLEAQFTAQIARAATNIRDALGEAISILTGGALPMEDIIERLNAINIDVQRISFADLRGDDIQQAIMSVFGAIGDDMAGAITTLFSDQNLDALTSFQQVGEGAFETVIRVASGIERAEAVLGKWGLAMIDWRDIADKQGDVTTELVRESVIAFGNMGAGVNDLVANFDGSAEDLITLVEKLQVVQGLLRAAGLDAAQLSQAMITGAGGLSALTQGLEVYTTRFFSAQEQVAAGTAAITARFTALGVTMPTTFEGLRAMIEHYRTLGDERMVGALLALVPAWVDVQDAAVEAAEQARNSWLDVMDLVDELEGRDPDVGRRQQSFMTQANATFTGLGGMDWNQMVTAFANMAKDPATWAGLSEAQQALITAILGLAVDIKGNTDSRNRNIHPDYYKDPEEIKSRNISQFYERYGDVIDGQKTRAGSISLESNLVRNQMEENEIRRAALREQFRGYSMPPEFYALEKANMAWAEKLRKLGVDLGRVTVLTAQYGEETGSAIFDLENWYASQKALIGDNHEALLALEKMYGDKRKEIIEQGVEQATQAQKQIADWRKNLLLSDASPLTAQQRMSEAMARYAELAEKIRGGDKSGLDEYTRIADMLLREGVSFWGRASKEYQDLFDMIRNDSGEFGDVEEDTPTGTHLVNIQSAIVHENGLLREEVASLKVEMSAVKEAIMAAAETQAQATRDAATLTANVVEAARR